MRIAVFVGTFPKLSETFIVRQVTGLLDLGHEVDIYADMQPEVGEGAHDEVTKYGLLQRTTYMDTPPESGYWELPVWPIAGRTWSPSSGTPILNVSRLFAATPKALRCLAVAPRLTIDSFNPSEYGYQARSLSTLYRLATLSLCSRGKKYDVLHAHFGPVGNSFRFARGLWRAPLVVSFHGYDFSMWPRKEGRHVYDRLFRDANAVTVNSDYTRQRLEELGCPRAKLHKIRVGLNPDDFSFRERSWLPGEPVRVLTVGRLVEKKGLAYAIRAAGIVRRQFPELRLDIVGEGPLRGELEKLIRQLDLERAVTLHGAQDGHRVRQMMDEAQLFILASVTALNGDQEGQGLVLQEAQASGLPVLATDHNGFPESLLPGRSGFLVPERDVDSLADQLGYLIEHHERWPEMGRAGRDFVERNFDIRTLNGRLVRLYTEVSGSWGADVSSSGQGSLLLNRRISGTRS
jgi:colanic acid/amylovoran biosynthesis glycosyltransferase